MADSSTFDSPTAHNALTAVTEQVLLNSMCSLIHALWATNARTYSTELNHPLAVFVSAAVNRRTIKLTVTLIKIGKDVLQRSLESTAFLTLELIVLRPDPRPFVSDYHVQF